MNQRRHIRRFLGAWQSGHAAARAGMVRKALRIVLRPFDRMLALGLPLKISGVEMPRSVLICSPPRSGSTITYQVVTRVLPVSAILNVHMVAPRSARRIIKWLHRILRQPTGFDNYYGHTTCWLDVNEGNEIVDYLFRDDNSAAIRQRFLDVCAWTGANAERPLVIKNVKIYDNLTALYRAVPELLFLRLHRDPAQIVQSELRGHYDLGTFNPIPAELRGISWGDPVEFAVRQIAAIDRTLDKQLSEIPASHRMDWAYEDFCGDPHGHIKELAARIGIAPEWLNWSGLGEGLRASMRLKVSSSEVDRINVLLTAEKDR